MGADINPFETQAERMPARGYGEARVIQVPGGNMLQVSGMLCVWNWRWTA